MRRRPAIGCGRFHVPQVERAYTGHAGPSKQRPRPLEGRQGGSAVQPCRISSSEHNLNYAAPSTAQPPRDAHPLQRVSRRNGKGVGRSAAWRARLRTSQDRTVVTTSRPPAAVQGSAMPSQLRDANVATCRPPDLVPHAPNGPCDPCDAGSRDWCKPFFGPCTTCARLVSYAYQSHPRAARCLNMHILNYRQINRSFIVADSIRLVIYRFPSTPLRQTHNCV